MVLVVIINADQLGFKTDVHDSLIADVALHAHRSTHGLEKSYGMPRSGARQ